MKRTGKRRAPRVEAGVSVLLVLGLLAALVGSAEAEQRVIELSIRDGRLPREQRLIRVQQGDDVTLRWTADRPVAVHLHGYDIEVALRPGVPGAMQFRARATGRFPIETHAATQGEEITLGYLEVYPP